jgi:hypothetical protein
MSLADILELQARRGVRTGDWRQQLDAAFDRAATIDFGYRKNLWSTSEPRPSSLAASLVLQPPAVTSKCRHLRA